MTSLFHFLYSKRAFIVFLSLTYMSMVLMKHRASCVASTMYVAVHIQKLINDLRNYPSLAKENDNLMRENAALREEVLRLTTRTTVSHQDDMATTHLIAARVVNNSIVGARNYLTLDKGTIHGIFPGMGVVSREGVVGKVKAVSNHFSTVISLLHTAMQISAQIARSKVLGTVKWSGNDPCRAQMLYVPRHVAVQTGDAVVTSGYNATFSSGVLIGHVKQAKLRKESPFYDIELHLSTDFSTLQHVYVVQHTLKQEKDDLEQYTRYFYESSQ